MKVLLIVLLSSVAAVSCKDLPGMPTRARSDDEIALPEHPDRVEFLGVEEGKHARLKDFPSRYARVQEEDVWCWAACAQMVSAFLGQEVSQDEIVERIKGRDESGELRIETATRYEILCAMNPDLAPFEPFEEIWAGLMEELEKNPASAIQAGFEVDEVMAIEAGGSLLSSTLLPPRRIRIEDLTDGYPSVVGLVDPEAGVGHAWVLYGVTYDKSWFAVTKDVLSVLDEELPWSEELTDCFGTYTVQEVELIDPWDGSSHVMSGEEFSAQLDFALSARDARLQLLSWRKVLKTRES